MRAAGFVELASYSFAEPRDWSFEEIVGYFQSTSVCSKRALGERFASFEADLSAALGVTEPSAHSFHEALRCGYTLGRKPT